MGSGPGWSEGPGVGAGAAVTLGDVTSLSAHRTLASESRVRILHLLQEHDRPLTVDEIAQAVDLHVNTTREHLDRLIATGFVSRESEVRLTRGRPRMLYRPLARAAAEDMDPRAREHLLQVLLEGYGRPVEPGAAEESGRTWGAELAATAAADDTPSDPPGAAPAAARQLDALERHFAELGFQPEVDAENARLHLTRCPVYDLACARAEVICAVHLGLARGVLAQVEGPLEAERLEPFVGPQHCVLHLTGA